MAGDQVTFYRRTQPYSTQCGNGGNEAIYDRRAASHGCSDKPSTHGSNVKSAHLCQHVDHIVFVRLIDCNGGFDDFFLFAEAVIRDATATTGHILHRCPQQDGQNSSGSSCVADAHFPDADHICVCGLCQFDAGQDSLYSLFPCHSRATNDILRSVGNFPIQHSRLLDIHIDTHIADGDAAAKVLAESGCSGLMTGQVDGLHQRDALGRTGHALCHHAVIGSEYQKVFLFDFVVYLSGDACKLDRQILQPSQASGGFGKLGLPLPCFGHSCFIQGRNRFYYFLQFHFYSSSNQRTEGAASITSNVKVGLGQSACA